jgi:hypothetical protein
VDIIKSGVADAIMVSLTVVPDNIPADFSFEFFR